MSRRKTTEEFIEEVKDKLITHPDFYKWDYSDVNYVNTNTKIKVICEDHGPFLIRPADHLRGVGCRFCSIERRANKKRSNIETFLNKITAVFKNHKFYSRWDYSETVYVGNKTKVKVYCSKHGYFWITPSDHLQGTTCKYCSIETRSESRKNKNVIIFNKLKYHSLILPLTYDDVRWLTKLSYSRVVTLCRRYGVIIDNQGPSKPELLLRENIKKILEELDICTEVIYNAKVLKHDKTKRLNQFKRNHEIDVYFPELHLGFEMNGLHWHREDNNDPTAKYEGYHRDKDATAKHQKITLYNIWEDEYSCEDDIDFWNEEITKIIKAKNMNSVVDSVQKHGTHIEI